MLGTISFSRNYLKTLQADYLRCIGQCFAGSDDDQHFWRRTAFEKWFNFLEGWLRIHREDVIPAMLEERGEEILRHYDLLDKELPLRKTPRDFDDVLKRVVFELLFLSRRHPEDYYKLVTYQNWQHLRVARKVRNHLAHPPCTWKAKIERPEMEALIGAYEWFVDVVNQIDYPEEMPKETCQCLE